MFSILIASFVVVCALTTIVLATFVLRAELAKRRSETEIILGPEPLRPEWIYPRRMDVPRKFPLLHTRSTKALR